MAGSRTWKSYTADNGTVYSVETDESNAEATITSDGADTPLLATRTANSPGKPCGLKMRYANTALSTNPNIRRKFYIGTSAAMIAAGADGATISAPIYPAASDAVGTDAVWSIRSLRGEKSRRAPAVAATDTGLTDGDITQ
jgi:hypothetical protein